MITLTDSEVVHAFMKFVIEDADADDLAVITGETFGGNCYTDGEKYTFSPDKYYGGAFNEQIYSELYKAFTQPVDVAFRGIIDGVIFCVFSSVEEVQVPLGPTISETAKNIEDAYENLESIT